MNVAIMTDENSGISQAEAEEFGVHVLKMPVIIDGEEFFEGVNLSHEEFYDALTSGKNVTTSMPSIGDVMDMWDELLETYDQVVYIPMSSGLSSSCASATAISDEYDGKVQVADNHRISVTLRQSVLDARKFAKEGKSASEIKELLEKTAYDASIYITVDTLEFLVKSGRVTAAGAALGAMLNIKPILTIQGEKLDAFAKVMGMAKSESKMIDAIKHDIDTRFADTTPDTLSIAAVSSLTDKAAIEKWTSTVKAAFPEYNVYYNHLSLSIGSHVGPNSVAVAVSKVY